MNYLLITLMLFSKGDTSKVVKTYDKITKSTVQLNKQLNKPSHNIDDLYNLQSKTYKTLMESHAFSKMLIIKQDSSKKALIETKADLQETKVYVKEVLTRQGTLENKVLTYAEFEEQVIIFQGTMRHVAFIASIGTLLLFLIRVSVVQYHRRKLSNL